MPLFADDLRVGDYVATNITVSNYRPGTPLLIRAISLPFISVQPTTPESTGPTSILPASSHFYRLTPDYVASFAPFIPVSNIGLAYLRGYSIDPSTLKPYGFANPTSPAQ